jgi:hypothetical protein
MMTFMIIYSETVDQDHCSVDNSCVVLQNYHLNFSQSLENIYDSNKY